MRVAGLGLLFWLLFALLAGGVEADPNRFALIIGSGRGDRDEVGLRYAESDAQHVADVLGTLGGFSSENTILLTKGEDASEARRLLIGLNLRLRQRAGESLLVVYYSGHADENALHLGGTHLPLEELRNLVGGSPAAARVLVLDACRSGEITRVKGGRPVPAVDVALQYPLGMQGLVLLSSSGAGEAAQESDQLGGSFFTHAFVSGLRGAADLDHNGEVTLSEVFGYANERTRAATARTVVGLQHPTYRYDNVGGRQELVLTRPGSVGRSFGALRFVRGGHYMVHRDGRHGPVAAELAAAEGGRRLALEGGGYFVVRRDLDHYEEGRFVVSPQRDTDVAPKSMTRFEYATVVRKGAERRPAALALFAGGGVRGEIYGLGTAWRTELGARLTLRQLAFELGAGFAQSTTVNSSIDIATRELSLFLAALYAFELGRVVLDVGLEAGGSLFWQSFARVAAPVRDPRGRALSGGLVAELEVPLPHRLYLRFEAAGLLYGVYLHQSDFDKDSIQPAGTYRGSLGLGLYL